jgi:hypothetical protein
MLSTEREYRLGILSITYGILKDYKQDWPTHDMLKLHLKYTVLFRLIRPSHITRQVDMAEIHHLSQVVMNEGLDTRTGVQERVWRVWVRVTKSKPSSNPYPFWQVKGLNAGL